MSYKKAFVNGLKQMLLAKSELDRLRFLPQRLEDGKLLNFNDDLLFKVEEAKDLVIFDKTRLSTRVTKKLLNDYLTNLDKYFYLFDDNRTEKKEEEELSIEDKILQNIEKDGDVEIFKILLKQIDLQVDDILELMEAKYKNNLDKAKEILFKTVEDVQEAEVIEKLTANELVEDFNYAIKDKAFDDARLILDEMDKNSADYKKCSKILAENEELNDDGIIQNIIEDLENCKNNRVKYAQFLNELREEIGEDDELYKKYAAQQQQNDRRRRRRRG